MAFFALRPRLSADDRLQRRRIILSDSLSLTILFIIAVLLALITNRFYQSYATHQTELANRWTARGEAALQHGNPQAAIIALRSALAYAPEERTTEVELAEALASAGNIQEATAYFNTLLESQPGNGMINLQLARLAVRQNKVPQALDYYQRAIYGTWEGNGYLRRREVRMELVQFLLSRHLYYQARNELLIAAGNAPEGDSNVQLGIAESMEQAQDPGDASRLYHTILDHKPSSLEANEGAGRAAFQLGHFMEARRYLGRALNNSAFDRQPVRTAQQFRDMFRDSTRLLQLYPSFQLNVRTRSMRILDDRKTAQARFASCQAKQAALQANTVSQNAGTPAQPPASPAPTPSGPVRHLAPLKGSLENLASRLEHLGAKPAESGTSEVSQPADEFAALAMRWQQQPKRITLSLLERDPDFAQGEVQLIYDTERVTEQICGTPIGDDALLLKIAQAPNAVEQE